LQIKIEKDTVNILIYIDIVIIIILIFVLLYNTRLLNNLSIPIDFLIMKSLKVSDAW